VPHDLVGRKAIMLLRKWFWPFLWVLLMPAVSAPLSVYLQSRITLYEGTELGLGNGGPWASRDEALGTFFPIMLNLVAFAWCIFGDGRARWAAFWAGVIGAGGAVVPFLVVLNTDSLGQDSIHYVYWFPTVTLVWLGAFNAWLAGLVAAIAFRVFVQARDRIRAVVPAREREQQSFSPVHSH
jgi:hypothetical protein